MTLAEALKKSDYCEHPNLNGILAANGNWGTFIRIYIDEKAISYFSDEINLSPDLVKSDDWTPVSFKISVEPIA